MCGIYALIHNGIKKIANYNPHHGCLGRRGPDSKAMIYEDNYNLAFYRLAINDLQLGQQPFFHNDCILLCNGEIYNYKQLIEEYGLNPKTKSDCEVIILLYEKIGIEKTTQLLDGEFAFILIDNTKGLVYFARDIIGVKPLYITLLEKVERPDTDETINLNETKESINFNELTSSDMKDFKIGDVYAIELSSLIRAMTTSGLRWHVQPRVLYTYNLHAKTICSQNYHQIMYVPNTLQDCTLSSYVNDKAIETLNNKCYELFRQAVIKRITMSDRPIGFLLSGGLDSSLVLSIAMDYFYEKKYTQVPKVFTFGFDSRAPDVLSATVMVNYLKKKYGDNCIDWHLVVQPVSDGLHAIKDVIRSIETYCTTTVRASTPMYLVSKWISENTDVKVLLSGEGSDELFGGYLYFNYAPSDIEFRCEIMLLLSNLYLYDALRADRTTANWSLEVRPPFLDKEFIEAVLTHPYLVRNCSKVFHGDKEVNSSTVLTKQLLRMIIKDRDLLPDEILYGRKEAFSDAVGYSWKNSIDAHAKEQLLHYYKRRNLNEEEYIYALAHHIPPVTNEMKYYQSIFSSWFGFDTFHILPAIWLPNQSWVKTGIEPSATVLSSYKTDKKIEF